MNKKRLIIFGSTGSIGVRTLDVVRDFRDRFEIVALSANTSAEKLREQIAEFKPLAACLGAGADSRALAGATGIPVFSGREGLVRLAREFEADLAIVATVGYAGVAPAIAALETGKDLALANKEVLVAAGDFVMALAQRLGRAVLPIDSEHNAIFQCMAGGKTHEIRRMILTASGGPFRRLPREAFESITPEQALAHPTWNMGPKITIDSATLMNKGFEAIEAHHLFGLPMSQVDVVIHPQSAVHSMVEFIDGSILAQIGPTDMYLPIQNILSFPNRWQTSIPPLDLTALGTMHFEAPDHARFPCLGLAYEAVRIGAGAGAALNAANEVAVERFLRNDIGFTDIPEIVREALEAHEPIAGAGIEAIEAADARARERANRYAVRA